MTGLCNAGSPASCVPGAKWTPNDPLFFLHHAVRILLLVSPYSIRLTTRLSQFVDKNWHEWQLKSPNNTNAIGGGTVQALDTFANFVAHPTGVAPLVTVSVLSGVCVVIATHILFCFQLDTELPGDGMWSDVKISDMMSTTGGKLCYTYA